MEEEHHLLNRRFPATQPIESPNSGFIAAELCEN